MRRFVSFGPGLIVLLSVAAVLFAAPAAIRQIDVARITGTVLQAQARLDNAAPLMERINEASRDIAHSVMPGVVHIQVRPSGGRRSGRDAGETPEEQNANPEREPPRRFGPRASAAGWFYNDDGFIVTNAHVVEDAGELRVELSDGRVRIAEVVGADPYTDIAVIKVDPRPGIVTPRRASGKGVAIGDRVFLFGSPFGIKFSMSQGIVSGLGRSEAASFLGMRSGYTNFIQTDAAMNPGNSGGPMVDVQGRVIGMATAIANNVQFSPDGPSAPTQGQSAGIGFAIPLETIDAVVNQLLESKTVLRGYMGVRLAGSASPEFLFNREIDFDGAGVPVISVQKSEPADKAGLRENDIILAVGGTPTPNSDVLRSMVSVRRPGETVAFRVWRDGVEMNVPVKVGAAYFVRPERGGEEELRYLPGSEDMTLQQIRQRLEGQPRANRVD